MKKKKRIGIAVIILLLIVGTATTVYAAKTYKIRVYECRNNQPDYHELYGHRKGVWIMVHVKDCEQTDGPYGGRQYVPGSDTNALSPSEINKILERTGGYERYTSNWYDVGYDYDVLYANGWKD